MFKVLCLESQTNFWEKRKKKFKGGNFQPFRDWEPENIVYGPLGLVPMSLGLVSEFLGLIPWSLGLIPGFIGLIPLSLSLVTGSLGLISRCVWDPRFGL